MLNNLNAKKMRERRICVLYSFYSLDIYYRQEVRGADIAEPMRILAIKLQ